MFLVFFLTQSRCPIDKKPFFWSQLGIVSKCLSHIRMWRENKHVYLWETSCAEKTGRGTCRIFSGTWPLAYWWERECFPDKYRTNPIHFKSSWMPTDTGDALHSASPFGCYMISDEVRNAMENIALKRVRPEGSGGWQQREQVPWKAGRRLSKSVESCLGLYPVAQSPEVTAMLTSWPATPWVSTLAPLFGQPAAASTVSHRKAWKWICNEPLWKTEASVSLLPTLCVVSVSLHRSFISLFSWIQNNLAWRLFCCGRLVLTGLSWNIWRCPIFWCRKHFGVLRLDKWVLCGMGSEHSAI